MQKINVVWTEVEFVDQQGNNDHFIRLSYVGIYVYFSLDGLHDAMAI